MTKINEFEKMFYQEVNEKKRIGIGVFNRASRRGYTGTIINHYDRLSAKEKRALEGVVRVYNERDDIKNIKAFDEIMAMTLEEGQKYINDVRERHTVLKLRKHWNVSSYTVYNKLYPKFKIETGKGNRTPDVKPKPVKENIVEKPEVLEVLGGFNIQLIGNFKGKELVNRILALSDLFEEDITYSIFLELKERE